MDTQIQWNFSIYRMDVITGQVFLDSRSPKEEAEEQTTSGIFQCQSMELICVFSSYTEMSPELRGHSMEKGLTSVEELGNMAMDAFIFLIYDLVSLSPEVRKHQGID